MNGCSCSKSRCIKKYCECYTQGIKCTRKCVCVDCKNFIEESGEGRNRAEENKGNEKKEEDKGREIGMGMGNEEMDVEFEEVDFYSGKRLG
jgi:hypothetical protein